MCCSVTPDVHVKFSDTVLYAAEAQVDDLGLVHVLGYQNRVQNQAGNGILGSLLSWLPGGKGNAMILPFPAKPKTMGKANVLDTSKCKTILQDIADTVAPPEQYLAMSASRGVKSVDEPKVQVFEAANIYTVVLAQDPRAIPDALDQVPKSKRPELNPELFDAYAHWFPEWTVALCCFNNRRAKLADPLLWWYEPMHPGRLFLPALDDHTGSVPDLEAEVDVDHVVAVSSHRMKRGKVVSFKNDLPDRIQKFVHGRAIGRRLRGIHPNGDFYFDISDVRKGKFRHERRSPLLAS